MSLKLTIQQRLTLAFVAIAILITLASVMGYWYTRAIEATLQTSQRDYNTALLVRRLRETQLEILSTVDSLILTHKTTLVKDELEPQLENYAATLDSIQDLSLGRDWSSTIANRRLQNELAAQGNGLIEAVKDINEQASKRRWGQALAIRQEVVDGLHASLVTTIDQLLFNLDTDARRSLAAATQTQNRARIFWTLTILLGVVESALLVVSTMRSITGPIRSLTAHVQRVTQGDFSPFEPLPQQDEVGELSRAFAMLTSWLRESYENLEQRVAARTRELEKRSTQIQVASEVARQATLSQDTDSLLDEMVNLIRGRFGFAHINLFLVDEGSNVARLRASTGEVGRRMLSENLAWPLDESNPVGGVVARGKPTIQTISPLRGNDSQYPLLPEARSLLATPLRVKAHTIGILEVFSQHEDAFNEEDASALGTIADQLAVAIENHRLVQDLQSKLLELETVYAHLSQEAWKKVLESQKISGFDYRDAEAVPLTGNAPNLEATSDAPPPSASIPLYVRGAPIGAIDVWSKDGQLGSEDRQFLESISARASQALESARLYQETLHNAAYERLMSDATSRLRETLDFDVILQNAAYEIRQLFDLAEVEIRLGESPEQATPPHFQEQTRPIR